MTDLLCAVLAGHLIGDWVLQTDYQAATKTKSWRSMIAHLWSYHLAILVLIVFLAPETSFGDGLAILGVSTATHGFLDRRWPVERLMTATGSEAFSQTWGLYAVDQALHLSVLLISIAVAN